MKTTFTCARLALGVALLMMLLLPISGSPVGAEGEPPLSGKRPEDCLPKDPPPPVVKLKVRVPAFSEPGQPILYCICIENCSPSEAHHVVVKNALPSNAKFVKAEPKPSKEGPELQWNLGT